MALRTILEFPDPRLRTKAQPVTRFDTSLATLIDDMLETMYAAPGIGLAATQVDVHQRIIVIDISKEHNEPLVLINPEILVRDGGVFERDFDDILAVCVQHEMDHLEGKLFVDYLSDLKRERIRKKLDKERRERLSQAIASAGSRRAY